METKTILRGTPQWRDLFYDNDVDAFMGASATYDRLRYAGDLSALLDQDRPKILVAGTRDIGAREEAVIREIIHIVAENPSRPVIVSGLAIGTDRTVHDAALQCGLPTVAVLPTGLDEVYPACNRSLAERICSTPGCALLTQFPDQTAPMAVNFLLRNKTMAMISDIAIIPFTKARGGTIVTARLMNERLRRVIAVPGRPDDIRSVGCNGLIAACIAEIYTPDITGNYLRDLNVLRKSSEYHYGQI